MSEQRIEVTQQGPVLRVTLTNPDRLNAQTPTLWDELAGIGEAIPSDVRVVVLAAHGRAFSAGLDRRLMLPGGIAGEPDLVGDGDPDAVQESIARFQRGFTVWREVPQIVVAAVQGHAIGAGLQLALAADLRIVADDVSFAMRETSLGLVPDLGGTHTLVHLIGYSRALEVCATGRAIGADEAVAWGLANLAVPVGELAQATDDLVAALVGAPAPALAALKPLLVAALTQSPGEQLLAERTAQVPLLRAMGRPRA